MTQDVTLGPVARGWRNASSLDALQLVTEGVATFAGFRVATMLVMDGDSCECVAVGGEGVPSGVLGSRPPKAFLCAALEVSESWGPLLFLSHEHLDLASIPHGTVPDLAPDADPDTWHPLNSLVVPLYGANGELRAALSMDDPLDGRLPGPEQRRRLESYALQARRTMLAVLDGEEMAERFAVAGAARRVTRAASGALSLREVLERSEAALLSGFAADELWWHLLGPAVELGDGGRDAGPAHVVSRGPGSPPTLPTAADAVARIAWREQDVLVARDDHPLHPDTVGDPEVVAMTEEFLARDVVGSLLILPLGAGEECLGMVVLHRRDGALWTTVEIEEALDVGHDLGRAVLNARDHEREQAQAQRWKTLEHYKSRLISTVSHELRTPLTSIIGNLELMKELISDGGLDPMLARAADATDRGARRLGAVVEDLLLLSQVSDPDASPPYEPVDLGAIVADVTALHATPARTKGIEISVSSPASVVVPGVPVELDRVVVNLVSNAVKYSPAGAGVRVSVEDLGKEVVLLCSDDGYGISAHDQEQLFREFFRSDDPEVRAVTGTGLGLAIVHRIVERHGGRIELESELGVGSTFRVVLPTESSSAT